MMDGRSVAINREKCTLCLLCEKVCLRQAVNISEYSIDRNKCFLCFHCVSICPEQAVTVNGIKSNRLSDRIYRLKPLLFPVLLFILGLKNSRKFFSLKNSIKRYHNGEDILAFNASVVFLFHTSAKISSTPAEDCDIASAIAMLRAEISGLGTCYNGYIVRALNFSRKIKVGLGIPSGHRVYTSLLTGYPGIKFKNLVHRDPVKINYV